MPKAHPGSLARLIAQARDGLTGFCVLALVPLTACAESTPLDGAWVSGLGVLALFALVVSLFFLSRGLRRTRDSLKKELERHDRLVAELPVGVYELLDDGAGPPRFDFISDRCLQMLGVSRAEVDADFYIAFSNFHPEDADRVKALNAQAQAEGSAFRVMTRVVKQGKTSWIQIQSKPRSVGRTRRWAGIITDVTEQTETARNLADSERLLASMSKLSAIGGWDLDIATGVVHWTEQTYAIHDLPSGEAPDLESALSFYHPEDRLTLEHTIANSIRCREPFDVTLRIRTATGRHLITRSLGQPVLRDGKVVGLVGAFQDITALAQSQQRLADAERRFRVLFERSPLAIMVHDAVSGAVLDANPAAWKSYGLDSLDALQERSLWADPPYSEQEALVRIRAAAEGEAQVFEWVSVDKAGRQLRELVHLVPLQIGGELRVVSSSMNISELHSVRQRFRAIFDESPVAVMVQDASTGELLEANEQAWRGWGFESLDDMYRRADQVWLEPPHDGAAALTRLQRAVAAGGERFEWPSRKVSGEKVWHEVSISPLDVEGRPCALVVAVDITIRREGELLLRESEERFRQLLEEIDGVAVQGYMIDGTVRYWNRASSDLYGYSSSEALGRNLLDLIIPPDMRDDVRQNLARIEQGGRIPNGELNLMHKDGHLVTVHSSHAIVQRPGQVPELFCVDIDISERKRFEDALRQIANYDPLTGLPNRSLLSELMREQTARADRSGRPYALCYLDLDEFKPINDLHGHEVGDKVLIAVADRLRHLIRGSDVVARLGGDEFVLILEGMDESGALDRRLEKLLDRISQPIAVDGLSLQVQGSVGVTLYPQDQADPDTLLRHADQAMYAAKQEGRNRYSLFDASLEEGVQRRRRRLEEIERGLHGSEFCLHYHPKVDLSDGRVVGMEALVRWQHPSEGLLAPSAFLGDLAHSDLEYAFGVRVIEMALAQMQAWLDQSLDFGVSVNVSGHHLLHPDFLQQLATALQRYPRVSPSQLVVEIVESAAVEDLELAVTVLNRVKGLGVQVSLDDFGTGYSSLSHLRSLPVDEVKVDQSFVRDMLNDLSDHNIVRSVLGLADAFGMRAVAEGVEAPEHIAALQSLGCALGQGYVFAKPLPAAEVPAWLAEWSHRAPALLNLPDQPHRPK